MSPDPIKDAAQAIVPGDAGPLTPEQEAAIGQLGPHMTTQDDTTAGDTAA